MWQRTQSLDHRVDATGWIHCDQRCRAAVEEAEKSAGKETSCSKKNQNTNKKTIKMDNYMKTLQSYRIT